jgi:peptidoglycan/xylan/chitin deacetylase (PgdA/CDA1 family)
MQGRFGNRRGLLLAVGIAAGLAGCAGGTAGSSSSPPAQRTGSTTPPRASSSTSTPSTPPRRHPSPIDPLAGPLPAAVRGHVPTLLPTHRRVVALTFDAGGDDGGLPAILHTLAHAHVPATFFMTGHFVSYYPSWARRVARRYPIGNHTQDHLDLTQLTSSQVRSEIEQARRTIDRITGRAPQPLFRFPYGADDTRTLRIVNALGYAAVGWSVDTLGWLGTSGGQTARSVLVHALAGLRPGEIILMHAGANPTDHSTLDANALPALIRRIQQRGYRFSSLPLAYARAYPQWAARR